MTPAGEAQVEDLEQGRAAPPGPDDLELLATSAYMLGLDNEYLGVLERAHHAHVEAGENLRAVRSAFWVGAEPES